MIGTPGCYDHVQLKKLIEVLLIQTIILLIKLPTTLHAYELRTKFGTWRTDRSRVGPLSVLSDGNPTTLSIILLWSYLILPDTHMFEASFLGEDLLKWQTDVYLADFFPVRSCHPLEFYIIKDYLGASFRCRNFNLGVNPHPIHLTQQNSGQETHIISLGVDLKQEGNWWLSDDW